MRLDREGDTSVCTPWLFVEGATYGAPTTEKEVNCLDVDRESVLLDSLSFFDREMRDWIPSKFLS